jgi:phosphoglucosamine mutase
MGRLFGTDGIRGVAGKFPLDKDTVKRFGFALGNLLEEGEPVVVIARDTRESGEEIEQALSIGLASSGVKVASAGILPTPAVSYLVRRFGFSAGCAISASHNPYPDNGIKFFDREGNKFSEALEQALEQSLSSISTPEEARRVHFASPSDLSAGYLKYLLDSGINLDGFKLAIDCANGATYDIAPRVFSALGASCSGYFVSPDGVNINEGCGSLLPQMLAERVKEEKLSLGIAFDGDGDRAIFVDSSGRVFDGDGILYLSALNMKKKGALARNTVAATVMSNLGLEHALLTSGIKMVRTGVGDRKVAEKMSELSLSLGGEQSGHIIYSRYGVTGDGIITALRVLEIMQEEKASLSELTRRFVRFPQVLINVPVKVKPPLSEIPELKRAIRKEERSLSGRGRVLVRYSGTELVARVMVEGEKEKEIEEIARRLSRVIERELSF